MFAVTAIPSVLFLIASLLVPESPRWLAAMGRKEQALREGRLAVELLPVEKDVLNGVRMIAGLARIAASVGDKDLACEQLTHASRLPNAIVTYGQLKLLPFWDPLRGDPCFEKIVESLAPR
jgi:hypothetical protein